MNQKIIKAFIIVGLFGFLSLLGIYIGAFWPDAECWRNWSLLIFKKGLPNAYTEWNNYMPFYQYVLYGYGKLMGTEARILHYTNTLKSVTFLFDFVGLWFVYKWIDKKTDYLLLLLFSMFNLAYSYNSLIWGQVDGIYCTMTFMALYYAYKEKTVVSAFWFILALNMKLQAIIFFPILGLIYLFNAAKNKSWLSLPYAIGLIAITQLVLLWPFICIPHGFDYFWKEVMAASTIYPYVVMGATNFWYFVVDNSLIEATDDAQKFFAGLSYKQAGLLLFMASSFAAMWPLLKCVWQRLVKGKGVSMVTAAQLWLMCSLVAILFFYFNTQMHERYSHPAFLFLTAYAFASRHFVAYIVFCFVYLVSLERVMKWASLPYHTFIFDARLIAALYALLIAYLFYRLYEKPKDSAGLMAGTVKE